MKFVTPLDDREVVTLEQCQKNHLNRRVRTRAHMILLSNKGYRLTEIAGIYSADPRTISAAIDRWEKKGIGGLSDSPRDGRPEKLTESEQQQVFDWIQQSPRNLKKVAAFVAQQIHKPVSRQTIKRIAKKNGWLSNESRKHQKSNLPKSSSIEERQ